MAETKYVKLQAFADLDDPVAGHVEANQDFETTPELGKQYVKANWAGPAGTDARDIQLQVAAEETQARAEAKKLATEGRQMFRNLGAGSLERGNESVQIGSVTPGVAVQAAVANVEAKQAGKDEDEVAKQASPDSDPSQSVQGEGGAGASGSRDYDAEMNQAEVYKEAKSRGLDVNKSDSKATLVKALEEDDRS